MYYEDGPVEDLIAIIRDFSDRNSYTDPTLGAAISLLGRFTLLENNTKTTEKTWRFLEIFLSNISLKEALQCRLDSTAIQWMLDPNRVLDRRLILGRIFDLSRSTRLDSKKRVCKNQNFATWDHGFIHKCYSFYFGCALPEQLTLLDLLVNIFRLLAMFARHSGNAHIIEVVYKFLPTFQMPSCELVSSGKSSLIMENWLLLVDYSVTLGLALNQQLQSSKGHNKADSVKCLELTVTYALSHARKLLSVDEMLEQVLAERSSFLSFVELRSKITNLAFKFLSNSIYLLPFADQYYDTLFEMLNSSTEYFLRRAQPTLAIDLAHNILKTKCTSNKGRFLNLFCSIVNGFKNDRTTWNTLLDLLMHVPDSFCLDMSPAILLKTFLFPVNTQEQIRKLEAVVKRHFKHRKPFAYDVEEFTQTWIYFEQWLLSKKDPVISLSALRIFSYIAPVLSDEDFRRCSKVLLSSGLFENNAIQINMLNMAMQIFAEHLRPGPIFDELLEGIVSNAFGDLLNNPSIQDHLFELMSKMFIIADNSQFSALMEILLEKFKIILQMALTDIWILLCDTAESSYNVLRHFLGVFKFCLSHPKLSEGFVKQFSGKCDIAVLLQTCADVFQNATSVSRELNKGAQTIASLLFILFSTSNSTSNTSNDHNQKTIGSIVESSSPSANFLLVCSMIHECFYYKNTSKHSPISTNHSSDGDNELTHSQTSLQNEHKSYAMIQEQMFVFTLRVFKQALTAALESDQSIEYEIGKICKLVENRHLNDHHLEELMLTLIDAAKCVSKCVTEKKTSSMGLKHLVDTIGHVLVLNPTSLNITQLLSFSYTNSECFESIMCSLERLLKGCELKPNYSIRFPQYLTQQETFRQLSCLGNRFDEAGAYFVLDPTYKIFANEGISVSFWLNLTQRKTNNFLHVISLGTSKLSIALYVNPKKNKLRISVTLKNQVVNETVFSNAFGKYNHWTNFTLGTICVGGQIETLLVFGNKAKTIIYDQSDTSVEFETFSISFGCVVSPVFELTTAYEITTIFGFKGLLNRQFALLLRSMGCARDSLTNSALSQIDYSLLNCLNKPVLRTHCELLFGNSRAFIDRIQKKLLFTINASSPHSYGLSTLQNRPEIDKFQSMTMLLTVSQEILITWRCQIDSWSPNSLDRSLYTIGHVKLFIFAYALSVDRGYSDKAQCLALNVLATALERDPTAHRVFTDMDGVSLIVRILSAESAHLTPQMFNILAGLVFSKLEHGPNDRVYVSPVTTILEPALLNALISSPDLWTGKKFKFWASLLQLTNDCLYETPELESVAKFNCHQLESINFLNTLLNTLLLMVRSPENYPTCVLSANNSKEQISLVVIINDLIDKLLETPVNVVKLVDFWNFIQLSHPPADIHIDKNVRGRNTWIQTDLSLPNEKPNVEGESELSIFINELCQKHSKEKIQECMSETNSIISVRNTFVGIPSIRKTPSDPNRLSSVFETKLIEEQQLEPSINETQSKQKSRCIQSESCWTIELHYLLLQKMNEIVLTCNDGTLACIELDVILWQTILVLLTKQRHLKTRTAIIKLLMNFFLRCNIRYRELFATQQGFVLLSNELRKSPINAEVVDALFSMTCGEPVTIFHGLDIRHLESIVYDKFKIFSLYALFTLLEESVDDYTMFWSICSTLQKMFISENAPRLAFFEMGLTNAMINVLKKLTSKCESPDLNGPIFPLLDCWTSFSRSIISMTVPYRDKIAFEHCKDFIWLCLIADWQSNNAQQTLKLVDELNLDFDSSTSTDSGVLIPQFPAATPRALRRMLCHLLFAWIDSIQGILSDPFTTNDQRLNDGSTEHSEENLDFEVVCPDSEWSFESVNRLELLRESTAKRQQRMLGSGEELAQRLLFGLQMINDSFIFLTSSDKVSDEEEALFNLQLELLISTWQKRLMDRKLNEWQTVLSLCKEKSLTLLADLIAYVLFPIQQKRMRLQFGENFKMSREFGDQRWMLVRRLRLARALSFELPANRHQLVSLLEINLDYQHAMKIAIHELALCSKRPDVLITDLDEDLDKLIKFLRSIQIKSPLYSLTDSEVHSLSTDEQLLLHSYYDNESEFVKNLVNKARWLRVREEDFLEIVARRAEKVTRVLVDNQSPLRKSTLHWRRCGESALAKASETLFDLVNQLCHPEAVFYDNNSWPKGSTLDTTENIKRERRRLKADHYNFPLKFLQKFRQDEVGNSANILSPLDRLLDEQLQSGSLNRSALERVEANSHIRRSLPVTLIRTVYECYGEIILSDKKLYFIGESSKSTQKGKYYAPVSYSWTFEQIREIQNRFYLLKDKAMELFTTTGEAFLIVFSDGKTRQMLLDHFINLNLGNLIVDTKEQLFMATKMWRNGQITNFDYLMFLNKLAGRTFNDLMQYPVFPFILSNYSSMTLDLNNSHSFRDLSRPMPIQDKKMESFYIQNYNTLQEECNKNSDSGFLHMSPYHYGSHYSNTGIVAHFMIRIVPYTNIAIEYQDNNFDIPDRLFSKLETTWRLSSSESTTDFKELIPEFFFFPEMFCNREGLELGVRQNGQTVNDVDLPPWCPSNNARLFCLIHRQALESAAATSALHTWIDLIFGYKQQGDAAIKAVNLFHPSTYRGRDFEQKSSGDLLYLNAILTMQKTYGQMPECLFQSPHLPHLNSGRQNSNSTENQLISSVRGLSWGTFLGSPAVNDRLDNSPTCVFQLEENEKIDHLVSLTYDGSITCYGLPVGTAMIAKYKTDREDILRRNFELSITAALSWTFPDRMLRIKQLQSDDSFWVNLMELSSFEVSKIAFSPSNDHLYLGFTNGLIRVYLLTFKNDMKQWSISHKSELFGHCNPITSLQISDNFHVALSTCPHHACLWDTNTLGFVRKFPSTKQPNVGERLKLSLISSISCDVALVYDSAFGSRVSLFTVNGDLIGNYSDNMIITSLAMTNLDEGTGINCLALGLETGSIRLLEVWTMTTIRLISCPRFMDPVVSLLFINNSSLYAAYASKTSNQNFVLCWTTSKKIQQTNFKMLNPFL